MIYNPDRVVALSAHDLDRILDALSALSHGLASGTLSDRVRAACAVDAIVQELGAAHDLPEAD